MCDYIVALLRLVLVVAPAFAIGVAQGVEPKSTVTLPTPRSQSELSVEGALLKRR